MQDRLRSIRQMAVMAAIVTTMLCVPVGALLAFLSAVLLGVSVHSFVTFGERFNAVGGLFVWWALAARALRRWTAHANTCITVQ